MFNWSNDQFFYKIQISFRIYPALHHYKDICHYPLRMYIYISPPITVQGIIHILHTLFF